MLRCEGARAPKNTVRIDRFFEIAFLMINFFLSSAAIGAFMVSTYGWGSLGVRIFHRRETESPGYTMGLGLAIWIFIGGTSTRREWPIRWLYTFYFLPVWQCSLHLFCYDFVNIILRM